MTECSHKWEPISATGEYEFRTNRQMWWGEKAHVRCANCRCRTFISRDELAAALSAEGQR